jgi:hypothetical protein
MIGKRRFNWSITISDVFFIDGGVDVVVLRFA